MITRSRASRTATLLGFCFSLLFIFYSLYHLNWLEFKGALSQISPGWLFTSMLAMFSTMLLRTSRWRIIAGLPRTQWQNIWRASCIGYAGTAILPARAGEVLRVLDLQRSGKVSTGLAIGSSALDRIVDAIALCAMIGLALLAFLSDKTIAKQFYWMTIILGALAAGICWFFYCGEHGLTLLEALRKRSAIINRLIGWTEDAFLELKPLQRWPYWLAISMLQVIISCLDVLACWFLLLSFGWHLPLSAAYITLICLAVGTTLPSTPGYIGVYQVAAMTALSQYGVSQSAALAYGTLLQICSFLLFISVGIWAYLFNNRRPSAT